jgi:hypothetical protein
VVDRPLPLQAGQAGEALRDDLDAEVALAAAVVAGMAAMARAVVGDRKVRWSERLFEPARDFRGDSAA